MSERGSHRFEFKAYQIAEAAQAEADYHRLRVAHWRGRYEEAARIVKGTVSAKVVESEVSGGIKSLTVTTDYGDPAAWQEASRSHRKVQEHQQAMDRYLTDFHLYDSQGDRAYLLDSDDVHHFRLAGQERPE